MAETIDVKEELLKLNAELSVLCSERPTCNEDINALRVKIEAIMARIDVLNAMIRIKTTLAINFAESAGDVSSTGTPQ